MTHDTTDTAASRRIMNAIGEANRIPILNVEEGDLSVLLGGPLVGLLVGSLLGLERAILPLILVGVGVGISIVCASPGHLPASEWLHTVARFYLGRQQRTFNVPHTRTTAAVDDAATEGGIVDYTPFTPDERTQEFTSIERAWPGAGAIERSDGALVGMVELDPGNMEFAMSDDWAELQEVGSQFANDELDFPMTLHATTQPFPVDQLVDEIDDRLEDAASDEHSAERDLLTEYRDRRPEEIADTTQIRYFIAVEVDPFAVYQQSQREPSPAERLARLPLVGLAVHPFVTRREQLTEAELRGRLLDQLHERLRTVETELVASAAGWSSRRLSTVELFSLAMEFWNGTTADDSESDASMRTTSVIGRQSREDARED